LILWWVLFTASNQETIPASSFLMQTVDMLRALTEGVRSTIGEAYLKDQWRLHHYTIAVAPYSHDRDNTEQLYADKNAQEEDADSS
jgi:hypothetical protein